ncbi:MAG: HD domain-containing protein [Candidatus Micrarchaeota archaeon]|nr:HD domain-containing protein [Candidatus Micrarchaeota archaeon]
MSYTYNPLYTHFKGDDLSRAELIERKVVEIILKSKMSDEDRSWSKTFELKHSSAVTQIGRILAQKRGLDSELGAIICAMHDISVFVTGRVTDHAHKGAPIARRILEKTKKFTPKEIELVTSAIYNHSDKHVVSKNPYVELVKDADVLDCGLYCGVHDAYIYEKSQESCKHYFARIQRVRKELGLPKDKKWDHLDYVEQGKAYFEKHEGHNHSKK